MPDKHAKLTVEGIEKLENELDMLKTVKRKEIAEKIKEARGFGDLSENAEYDEAKNEQGQVETRIVYLENLLKNAEVIDEDEVSLDVVSVGSKLTIKDHDFDEESDISIVGTTEANPTKGKISDESPIGRALIGKKAGDVVHVPVPDGSVKIEILNIHR